MEGNCSGSRLLDYLCPKKEKEDGSWDPEFQNIFQSVLGVPAKCPLWFYQHNRNSPEVKDQSAEFSKGICGISASYTVYLLTLPYVNYPMHIILQDLQNTSFSLGFFGGGCMCQKHVYHCYFSCLICI